jgi:hypothetical protein
MNALPLQSYAESRPETAKTTRKGPAVWAGRVLFGLSILFFLADSSIKLEGTAQLGYPPGVTFGIGAVLFVCLALYAIPRTAVLGAVLLTGYLGGAVATHVRVENPLFSHTLFPIYVGIALWAGLWLRSEKLRALFPILK